MNIICRKKLAFKDLIKGRIINAFEQELKALMARFHRGLECRRVRFNFLQVIRVLLLTVGLARTWFMLFVG